MPGSAGAARGGVSLQTELPTERRSHAVASEDVLFDFGDLQSFGADPFNDQRQSLVIRHMTNGGDHDPALAQELGLPLRQHVGVVAEIRPVQISPVPVHEREYGALSFTIVAICER